MSADIIQLKLSLSAKEKTIHSLISQAVTETTMAITESYKARGITLSEGFLESDELRFAAVATASKWLREAGEELQSLLNKPTTKIQHEILAALAE